MGVIVGVEKETCKVLTNTGEGGKPDIRVCRLPDLKRKINNRRASAQDGGKLIKHIEHIHSISFCSAWIMLLMAIHSVNISDGFTWFLTKIMTLCSLFLLQPKMRSTSTTLFK